MSNVLPPLLIESPRKMKWTDDKSWPTSRCVCEFANVAIVWVPDRNSRTKKRKQLSHKQWIKATPGEQFRRDANMKRFASTHTQPSTHKNCLSFLVFYVENGWLRVFSEMRNGITLKLSALHRCSIATIPNAVYHTRTLPVFMRRWNFLHVAFFGIRMCKQLNLIMIFIKVYLNIRSVDAEALSICHCLPPHSDTCCWLAPAAIDSIFVYCISNR